MNWTACPFVMIDTETTGLPWISSRVVEVGATAFKLSSEPTKPEFLGTFQSLVNPGRCALEGPQALKALEINQISPTDLECAPPFPEVAKGLANFLEEVAKQNRGCDLILAAYNAEFDFQMLAAEYIRCGTEMPLSIINNHKNNFSGWVDPLIWCRDAFIGVKEGHSLSAQRKRLSLTTEGPAHRALNDAIDSAKIFNWLTLGGHHALTNSRIYGTPFCDLNELLTWQEMLASSQNHIKKKNILFNHIKQTA